MEPSELSLKELFIEAKARQAELEHLDPRADVFSHTLQSIIVGLERCRQLIQQLSLFSRNEEVEDISTQDLQYVTPSPHGDKVCL